MKIAEIKARLRRVPWVYLINRRLKAWRLKRRYDQTVRFYSQKNESDSCELPDIHSQQNHHEKGSHCEALNIVFLGTDESQDRSGLLQALEKRGTLRCFTRADGSYGQNHPGMAEEKRKSNSDRLMELSRLWESQGCEPNILIAQTWASYIDGRVLDHIRRKFGTVVVNIAMDDRHQYWGDRIAGQWGGTYGLIPHIDLALTAAPECVDWYRKENCPALYFPEASDPDIFHPMTELPKIHDVAFVGGRYGIREWIVLALRDAGINVTAYGHGWESDRIDTRDVPSLFAQSKIVLGVGTIGHCTDFYALKLRDFDGPMSGSLYLTHDNPDLHDLYVVGEEIVTYRSIKHCVEQVQYYLEHDSEREIIASAGHARAKADHTWDRRFNDVFELLNGHHGEKNRPDITLRTDLKKHQEEAG